MCVCVFQLCRFYCMRRILFGLFGCIRCCDGFPALPVPNTLVRRIAGGSFVHSINFEAIAIEATYAIEDEDVLEHEARTGK